MKAFQLPFRGSWFVYWGGDTKQLNIHHGDTAENYALDLVILDDKGSRHKGSGHKNEDYYAFGQDILAPADGVVIEAVDGHRGHRGLHGGESAGGGFGGQLRDPVGQGRGGV